jgi:predicted HicB family RNase H-like nuclease
MAEEKIYKVAVTFRVLPETARKLKEASRADGVSQSIYVEQTLRARFKKDGVK